MQMVTSFFCAETFALLGIFATRQAKKQIRSLYRHMKHVKKVTKSVFQETMEKRNSAEKISLHTSQRCMQMKKFMKVTKKLKNSEKTSCRYAEQFLSEILNNIRSL